MRYSISPNDAIDYLKSKGFKIGWDWHETLDDAHSRAFTVAKVARIDLLQDIRSSLVTAMEKVKRWSNGKPVLHRHCKLKVGGERKLLSIPKAVNKKFSLAVHDAYARFMIPICNPHLQLGVIKP